MHVRKNDQVMVITGKDKNTKGKITVAFPKTGKVIVEGVNMVTRHQKARNAMQPGGIVKKEAAIDASNVMLIFFASAGDLPFVETEIVMSS